MPETIAQYGVFLRYPEYGEMNKEYIQIIQFPRRIFITLDLAENYASKNNINMSQENRSKGYEYFANLIEN